MAWPESLSGDLPPPHADEPDSLRQDIADELADHLASSADEARARGADEATARLAALDRFGDPAAVARQLWLEAMKGPIMRQRTLMVAAALLVLGVFAANGLAWMAFQQLRDSNAALVAQLAAANNKPELGQFADLTVKLIKDDATGEPVEGCHISLQGHAAVSVIPARAGDGSMMVLNEDTNSQGVARYAPILPGNYNLLASTPSGWELQRNLSLLARPWIETIRVPASPPETVKLSVEFVWPEDIRDELLAFYLSFSTHPASPFDGESQWFLPSSTLNRLFTFRDGRQVVQTVSSSGLRLDFEPVQVYPGAIRVTGQVLDRRSSEDTQEGVPRYSQILELEPTSDFKTAEFLAKAGKDNHWRISLSPTGIKRVRDALAKLKSSTEKEG